MPDEPYMGAADEALQRLEAYYKHKLNQCRFWAMTMNILLCVLFITAILLK